MFWNRWCILLLLNSRWYLPVFIKKVIQKSGGFRFVLNYKVKCVSLLDFLVYLSGGRGPNEGTIHILHNGVYGSICDDSFGEPEARVICRMLGYTGYNHFSKQKQKKMFKVTKNKENVTGHISLWLVMLLKLACLTFVTCVICRSVSEHRDKDTLIR